MGLTQVRNFAAKAEAELRKWAGLVESRGMPEDAKASIALADSIQRSVHFALPDGGLMLDDELRGLDGVDLRLPYPEVTIEYLVKDDSLVGENSVHSPKRLVVATEVSLEFVKSVLPASYSTDPSLFGSEVFILVRAVNMIHGVWMPVWAGFFLPQCWSQIGRSGNQGRIEKIAGIPFPIMPDSASQILNKSAREDVHGLMAQDITGEVWALLELCEALTCINVHQQLGNKISKKVNQRRIGKGKLPLYEVKTLVIDAPGNKHRDSLSAPSFDRSGPRQHLRRGHIRRLADGRRIWVNACVVGNEQQGVIDKNYAARKA